MIKRFFIVLLFALIPLPGMSEIIHLKDGKILDAQIIEYRNGKFSVLTENRKMTDLNEQTIRFIFPEEKSFSEFLNNIAEIRTRFSTDRIYVLTKNDELYEGKLIQYGNEIYMEASQGKLIQLSKNSLEGIYYPEQTVLTPEKKEPLSDYFMELSGGIGFFYSPESETESYTYSQTEWKEKTDTPYSFAFSLAGKVYRRFGENLLIGPGLSFQRYSSPLIASSAYENTSTGDTGKEEIHLSSSVSLLLELRYFPERIGEGLFFQIEAGPHWFYLDFTEKEGSYSDTQAVTSDAGFRVEGSIGFPVINEKIFLQLKAGYSLMNFSNKSKDYLYSSKPTKRYELSLIETWLYASYFFDL